MFGVNARETSGGIRLFRPSGGVVLGSAAVVLSLVVAACSGGGQGARGGDPTDQVPDDPTLRQSAPLTDEQLEQMSASMSRTIKTSKRNPLSLGQPKVIPALAPTGGITVSAYIKKKKDASPQIESRSLPEGATRAQVQAALAELGAIPGARVVDWSLPPQLNSVAPNDPRWNPNPAEPNLAVPFARIGLCCSNDGLLDGWDISSRIYANSQPADVNIAIIDSGLVKQDQNKDAAGIAAIETDLKSRFIGGWDSTNEAAGTAPIPWATYPDGNDNVEKNAHGTDVAGYALATADNAIGTAGPAGNLPNVKFGMFRYLPYKDAAGTGTTGPLPIKGGYKGALEIILRQVTAYQAINPGADARNWNVVNMSLATPISDKVDSKLVDDLVDKGVLIISGAGNYRQTIAAAKVPEYGRNPIVWPASYSSNTSVASWGSQPKQTAWAPPKTKNVFDYSAMYTDVTSGFSSFGVGVDIAAPGAALPGIASGRYVNMADDGTSLSAPVVSGIAASMISISGDRYRCTTKGTPTERRGCVEDLRSVLVGSTSDVTGKAETFAMQGAGVIDVPRAFLGAPSITVPKAPTGLKGTLTLSNVTDQDYDVKTDIKWDEVKSPDLDTRDKSIDSVEVQYQVYVDGDLTRGFDKDAGDIWDTSKTADAVGARRNASGNGWTIPSLWTDYRIPIPRTLLPPFNTKATGIIHMFGRTTEIQVSVTTVYMYKKGGKYRRQAESLPTSMICNVFDGKGNPLSLPAGVDEADPAEIYTIACNPSVP